MRHYEVNFIVDPILSGDDVKATADFVINGLMSNGCSITAVDELGLRQLAYPINERSTGVYYCVEFTCESSEWVNKFELGLTRRESILRYLTIKLDQHGVKYNDDKRNGRIGKRRQQAIDDLAAEKAAIETGVIDLDDAI